MQVQQYNGSWTNNLPAFFNSCPWPLRYINSGNPVPSQSFGINTLGNANGYNCN
jgi:hypothetical protein